MIPIPPQALKLGAYALVLGACWTHGCHHGESTVKAEYLQYRANVEAVGKLAQKEADAIKATNEARKAASDESYSKALSVLGADLERLRKRADSYPNSLPAPPASATCPPEQRCIDRGEFDSAFARYWESEEESERATNELVGEGATLKLRMDEAISWANRLN